jgi:TonB family protein
VTRWLLPICLLSPCSVSLLDAQSATPAVALPRAVYAPKPDYRPEWAKQGLKGKGVVLVTINPKTGTVTGARMLQSTGSQLLDGAALQAYSRWRFQPGSVSQVKMPIEFKGGPPGQRPPRPAQQWPASFWLLLLIGLMAILSVVPKLFSRRRPHETAF